MLLCYFIFKICEKVKTMLRLMGGGVDASECWAFRERMETKSLRLIGWMNNINDWIMQSLAVTISRSG